MVTLWLSDRKRCQCKWYSLKSQLVAFTQKSVKIRGTLKGRTRVPDGQVVYKAHVQKATLNRSEQTTVSCPESWHRWLSNVLTLVFLITTVDAFEHFYQILNKLVAAGSPIVQWWSPPTPGTEPDILIDLHQPAGTRVKGAGGHIQTHTHTQASILLWLEIETVWNCCTQRQQETASATSGLDARQYGRECILYVKYLQNWQIVTDEWRSSWASTKFSSLLTNLINFYGWFFADTIGVGKNNQPSLIQHIHVQPK